MNKSATESGIDCQSCTNDIILLIKHNARFVFSFSWIFRSNVQCNATVNTSVVIEFSLHTLMQISFKKTITASKNAIIEIETEKQ